MSRDLTIAQIDALKEGAHRVAPGLYVRVYGKTRMRGLGSRSFWFRYSLHNKPKWQLIGPLEFVTLKEAKAKVAGFKADLFHKREIGVSPAGKMTFREAAEKVLPGLTSKVTPATRQNWRYQLISVAAEHFGDTPLADITPENVRKLLASLWTSKPVQAEKLATRMSRIFEAAKVHKWCSGNPASRETVKALLGTVERPEGHFKSLPYKRIPKLMMQLQGIDTEASMGLQLMILTAARTCEIRAASWGEFDLEARTWNVPAPHMKGKIAHSVFLNLPAMEILEQLHSTTGVRGRLFSFGQHAMKELARELTGDDGLTGHGMRASFRTWAEAHDFADRIIEDSLAHKDKNRTRRAYRRPEELFEKRAKMLMAWGNYCRSDFKGRDKLLAAAEAKEHADLNKLLGNAEMNKPRLRIVK